MKNPGRWLLGGVAVIAATSGYPVDWNRTHLFNPNWPPHAKFHDAWSLLLGTGLGASSLVYLRKGDVDTAALLLALFWAAQAGSFAFPNTGGMATEFPELVPAVAGMRLNEAAGSATMLSLTAIGYALARRDAA